MQKTETKYDLNREFADFFDEAIGMVLGQEIRECDQRYEAGSQLAVGGMKRIITTQDHITGRPVAKAMMKDSSDPVKVEKFFHEARTCASLEHPNIVPVYDIGYDEDNEPFFTMKLIHGQNLKDLIKSNDTERTDLLVIFLKICDAIAYAHSHGVIHRDLKPDNIQISSFGEVLVCDWGLSRREGTIEDGEDDFESPSAPVTIDGVIQGTPGYMSPEQARGDKEKVDKPTDIYSLGAILYFILSKKPPLCDKDISKVIDLTSKGEIPALTEISPSVPSPLSAICKKAMNLDPKERYSSAEELKKDVFNFIHGYATSAENIGLLGLFRLMIARNRRISLILSTSIIIILSLVAWFIISLNLSRTEALSAKKVAETALVKFKEAEEVKHKLTKDAAPRILERVHDALWTYEFDEALEICNFAIDLDYDLLTAHSQKGYILLSLLRFEEALKEFKTAKYAKHHKAVIACNTFIKHFGSRKNFTLDDFIFVIDTYRKLNMKQMIKEQVFSPTMNGLSVEERRQFAQKILKLHNPKLGNVTFEEDKVILNWNKLIDASGLFKTGITHANLERSNLTSVLIIKGNPIETLYWPNISESKLKQTNLLTTLRLCKTLREIHLPKKFRKKDLALIPPNVKVMYYND